MVIRTTLVAAFAFVVAAASQAAESVHLYIKTSGQGHIQGSSTDGKHKGWIEVMSWSSGVARDSASGLATGRRSSSSSSSASSDVETAREAGSGMATGRRLHKPLTLTMELGRYTQQFFQALCTNENVVECMISITDDAGVTKTGTLSKVSFCDFSVMRSVSPQAPPTCEVSFTYAKIEWK